MSDAKNYLTGTQNNEAETKPSSFVDTVYQQVNSVLGGDNPNQYLCLTIPGQALAAEDFAYDYKNGGEKETRIEANESRLANKLFDPCRMTGADNGLSLPYQYRTALDMLTPKLNAKIASAKHQLRELLMTEYPYDFGDEDEKAYTLQEVFFRLYDEWADECKKWAEEQNEAKKKYKDDYLEWYEINAESRLNAINEKMSKVISVFTPNDMKILEGVLDSGSGAELQEARETLTNTRKLTPTGGYVYPVKFNPANWFELLDTSFTPMDLLKSPDVLATELSALSSRRIALSSRIAEISDIIPDKSEIQKAQEDVKTAKDALDAAQSELIGSYGDGIRTVLNTVFDILPLFSGGAIPAEIIKKLGSGVELKEGKSLDDLVKDVTDKLKDNTSAQQTYINAAQNLANASKSAIEKQNLAQLNSVLSPMKEQLEQLNMQIDDLKAQIQMSALTRPAPDANGDIKDTDTSVNAVAPPSVPKGYTQIVITADASTLDKESESHASSSASTSGASLWFCGYQSSSSESSSSFKELTGEAETEIQIGMNVAKVGIERDWFNPGVFALTKDMFSVTSQKIAPEQHYDSVSDTRLEEMGKTVFPCFPTAMVIARDISIKLVSKSNITSAFAESVEKHASSGGGFLFFSGSRSSSSSSSSSGVHAVSTSNTVTLRFDTPQIIGYYMEATAADKSTYLDDVSADEQAGFVSIERFVEDYKKILESMNKKDKKEG